jgi:hypothetical protein
MRTRIVPITFLLTAAIAIPALLIGWTAKPPHSTSDDIRRSIGKSLPLLQMSGEKFIARSKGHCVSCHHNLLTALVEEKSRLKGIPFTDTFRIKRVQTMLLGLQFASNINLPTDFLAVKFIPAYALMELHADGYAPDPNTDITVDYLMGQQHPDGSFGAEYGRPPQEGGEAHLAALAIRDIQWYATPAKTQKVNEQVTRTRRFLNTYHSDVQQELVFQLLGLQWCGASAEEKEKAASRLREAQHPDGSWSQLKTMPGDAYATGQALYALAESGAIKPGEESYNKGIAWLLKTQDPTGAWIVQTRAYPIQPFFSSDFPPYDENQYISAAATNWASLALLDALPDTQK